MATSIRLSSEVEQRLDFLASQTGRTKAFYLREIIERGLNDMEDYYLAADVVERVRKGQEKVYPADEVRQSLLMRVSH
jgi:RHH-type rel operon transcriptional repressor/antitoxin RelB